MDKKQYFIIDFDSTFVKDEGLEVLAEITLERHPQKSEMMNQIQSITAQAMNGEIPFDESLKRRIELLHADSKAIEKTVKRLKRSVTPSIKRNKEFFTEFKDQIYIISGGFTDFILPVVEPFGIPKNHVLANTFMIDKTGKVTGYDKKNVLSQKGGKQKAVKSLGLKGEIIVIGDGYTDFEIRQAGLATKFIAFTENVLREQVTKNADKTVPSFDEFLYINKLPTSLSYPKSRIKTVLLENIDKDAVNILEKEGYQVEWYQKSLTGDELFEKIKNAHIIGIRSRTEIRREMLKQMNKLLAIGAFCIGTDQIDLLDAAERGIAVFNAPYSNTRSVVELVIGEIIMLMRGIPEKNAKLHKGEWDKSAVGSHEVRGKTLGIIGYGNIGSQLSVLAEALGMNVLFYDVLEKLSLGNAKRCLTLSELLKNADIVTVHVDGRKENESLIGKKEFSQMKDGVIFLNLSRGKMVDLPALHEAITSGKVKGAALDVFPKEPKGKDELFESPLRGLSNVILTPHIGGSTQEAQQNIAQYVSKKLIAYINSGNTYLNVSLPIIQPPEGKNAHRLLHIHKNVPGVLAHINGTLAKHKMNILGQYLQTTENVGYVITDINKKYDKKVLEELKEIPETVRFRVLY